jgi:hypothetical protein
MPTVVDPKVNVNNETANTPTYEMPEMFAAEVEMEKKSSSLGPLVMIFALVAVVGGTIFYFVKTSREVLSVPAATTAVNQILKTQGDGKITFSVGTLVSSVNEKPNDPHYKLLAKAGILNVNQKSYNTIVANLTPAGEKLLSEIAGVEKGKNADDNVTYTVPLAQREMVQIDKITMIKPHLARVDYAWKWVPNRLGKDFDASSDLVHNFNTWDRGNLIKNYGVDFYGAAPTKATVVLMEAKEGIWKPYVD